MSKKTSVRKEIKESNFRDYLNVYEFEVVLPGSGEGLVFKPVTTGELKKLLVHENEKDERVIERALDGLMSASVISEGFNIDDMYLQDRFFLLVELRKRSKGELYKFTFKCPQCESQVMQSVDLNKLEIKLPPEKVNPYLKLSDNIAVNLKYVTRSEQLEAHKMFDGKGLSPLQRATEMALLTDAAGIDTVITPDGEENSLSILDKKYLLENIPSGAYDKIKEWQEGNTFGTNFKFTMECGCGHEEKMEIPLDNFFF